MVYFYKKHFFPVKGIFLKKKNLGGFSLGYDSLNPIKPGLIFLCQPWFWLECDQLLSRALSPLFSV